MIDFQFTTWGELAFLVALGIAPSAVWLTYYLHQDNEPEPKHMVVKVFVYGFFSTFIAFGVEWALITAMLDWRNACLQCQYIIPQLIEFTAVPTMLFLSLAILSVLALVEEWVKYTAARLPIIRSPYFDEPVDAMVYLIVAALGFAAAENIGYIFQNVDFAIGIAYFRFLSSTFLHALASAIVGYFFALSLIYQRRHLLYISFGLIVATLLHAVFNFLIITSEQSRHATLSVVLLMVGAFFFVSYLFRRIRHLSF